MKPTMLSTVMTGYWIISKVNWWQDPYCFNDVINIFTRESVGEEDISTSIHDYSHPVSQNDTGND